MIRCKECTSRPASLIAAACLLGFVGAASAQSVRLWSQATVVDSSVRLGDVAEVQGLAASAAQVWLDLVIADAPAPGKSRLVTYQLVRDALDKRGANLAVLQISGALRCEVHRPGALADADADTANGKQPTTQPADGEASVHQAVPGSLEAVLRERIEGDLAAVEGEVRIRFGRGSQNALGLSAPQYRFELRRRSHESCGLVSFEVDVIPAAPGEAPQRIDILAEVTVGKRVVVARRGINRGAAIAAKDLALEMRWFDRVDRIGLCDLNAAVGQQAARFVDRGEMLSQRDVRPRPLVRRGELVTVYSRAGDLVLKTAARALGEATFGQTVEVRNEASGEQYLVTVTGPQTGKIEVRQ